MRPFGWTIEEHSGYDCDSGWLLFRDTWHWDSVKRRWRERMRVLRHPIRARRWKRYGPAIQALFPRRRPWMPYGPGGLLAATLERSPESEEFVFFGALPVITSDQVRPGQLYLMSSNGMGLPPRPTT